MSDESTPKLRLRGVTKRFGPVTANAQIDLDLRGGEVHCVLGENGAGKSTLISMLAGFQQPDEGIIEIDGRACTLASPAVALARGIGVVYQHSALIPTMSVLENLMLGQRRGVLLDRAAAEDLLTEIGEMFGGRIDPDTAVHELGLGQRQQLEIAKVLWEKPEVLVLDEPTSMLAAEGVERLKAGVRRLADEGVAVLFVTHKLHEALELGDRVSVLRAGRVALSVDTDELRTQDSQEVEGRILVAMFGDETTSKLGESGQGALALDAASSEVLRLESVSVAGEPGSSPATEVSLAIRAGEILGIAGIDGHGQRHLAEAIAGQRPLTGGRLLLGGRNISRESVRSRQRLGVRYVTDDRLHEGIVGSFSVAINLLLKHIGNRPFWRFGRMDRAAVAAEATHLIERYEIRPPASDARAGTLSGGNIQKLLLARELAGEATVVVLNKPTYGLDLRTVRRVRDEIRQFAERGGAVLLISTDLDELKELANSISVISRGRIVGRVENDGVRVRERVGALIVAGIDQDRAAQVPRAAGRVAEDEAGGVAK